MCESCFTLTRTTHTQTGLPVCLIESFWIKLNTCIITEHTISGFTFLLFHGCSETLCGLVQVEVTLFVPIRDDSASNLTSEQGQLEVCVQLNWMFKYIKWYFPHFIYCTGTFLFVDCRESCCALGTVWAQLY